MKLTIVITTLLLSILAASPASASWETSAAVEKYVRESTSKEVKDLVVEASNIKPQDFTWRSPNIPIEQWLARWVRPESEYDNGPRPSNVFVKGFSPKVDLFDAVNKYYDTDDLSALDLKTYVATNTPSVFVSTTRYVRNDGYIWTPRKKDNAFRYDIFAPGGIDVNPTLGPHEFQNQNEIAFVGGIHTAFIHGALEYTSQKTQKCYHMNPNYKGSPIANGAYPRINKKLPLVFYNTDGSVKDSASSQYWSRINKRSVTINNKTMGMDRSSMAYSESFGPFCYKVTIQSISFDQTHEYDLNKHYGKINVFIQKPSYATVWDGSKRDISHAMKKLQVNGKEVFLKADIFSNPRICFEGSIYSYDQNLTHDNKQISHFTSSSCVKTQSSFPSKKYVLTSNPKEGSVKIQFKVARCGN